MNYKSDKSKGCQISLLILALLVLLFFTGCKEKEKEVVTAENGLPTMEISEEMFVTQINDIYVNTDDYMNKNIKLQGFYLISEYDGKYYNNVVRNGPGCCTTDSLAGFEFYWDGDLPEENDWIEVVGTLEWLEEDGIEYLCLNLSSLTVMEERGLETVTH
ncbi:hypothetical protein [Sinanaerobacter chloroacetimidivorans]|jgi:putative membrane protein|uniref:DUF1980 domain-containing protein n=1 Tax=Sinanaerobacter chloroacetimidivorans TaxID=2818044 RepID=A0A8J8B3G1_9FIRM|nr:hypothetical protein [Sinanaerobacter chloroacetimidivorans]MBR0598285.1 hypothetical protein [Sinanaerobacter chloroacetimidivorans]